MPWETRLPRYTVIPLLLFFPFLPVHSIFLHSHPLPTPKFLACSTSLDQCRRKPKWAPRTFWWLFFSRHPPKQRPSFSCHCPLSSSVWALYVTLSSLTLPLHQRVRTYGLSLPIRPFQAPFTPWWGLLCPWAPGRQVRRWSDPALVWAYVCFISLYSTVASLGLVSPGAATEGVTPFSLKKLTDFFCHHCLSVSYLHSVAPIYFFLKNWILFFLLITVTTDFTRVSPPRQCHPTHFFTCLTWFVHYSL